MLLKFAMPCGRRLNPRSRPATDCPFRDLDVSEVRKVSSGFTQRGVLDFEKTLEGCEVNLDPVSKRGHEGKPNRCEERIVELMPWMLHAFGRIRVGSVDARSMTKNTVIPTLVVAAVLSSSESG